MTDLKFMENEELFDIARRGVTSGEYASRWQEEAHKALDILRQRSRDWDVAERAGWMQHLRIRELEKQRDQHRDAARYLAIELSRLRENYSPMGESLEGKVRDLEARVKDLEVQRGGG